jgi:hypothetical protein
MFRQRPIAVDGRWTMSRFDQELGVRYGARRSGGRIKVIPPDKADVLAQIEMMCEEWKRWHVALQRKPDSGAKRASEADLPPLVDKRIKAALKQIEDLQWSVGNELNRMVPSRIPRAAKRTRKQESGDLLLGDVWSFGGG